MHELSLASAIVNTVVDHAGGQRVSLVRVLVGRLRQVVPDSLDFYFEITARDTVCEGARLELIDVPARLHCGSCGRDWDIEIPAFICPICGLAAASQVAVTSGEEFQVESIDVEQEEPACIGPR